MALFSPKVTNTLLLLPTVSVCVSKPMYDTCNLSPGLASTEHLPLTSVAAPALVDITTTLAPTTGSLFWSTTVTNTVPARCPACDA